MVKTKQDLIRKVNEVVAASSVCPELKEVGMKYLTGAETDEEPELRKLLFAELEEDVCTLDNVIPFFESEAAEKIFGAEQAKMMTKIAKEKKAVGGKYCICPACTAGGEILDSRDIIE